MNKLFEPFRLRSLNLRNRVVMAPMTRQLSPGNFPNDDVIDYYTRRAIGGTGLIISEGTCISHPAANGYPDVPYFYGDKAIAGWSKLIESVHDHGSAFFPQLWHVGAMREVGAQPDPTVEAVSPSGLMLPNVQSGRALSTTDIKMVVESYGEAAKVAANIGADGVEIHGAHGYLIDQFFWAGTNRRTDDYGGSFENRSRFANEVVTEVRRNLGNAPIISFRLSQWKQQEFGARLVDSPQQLEKFLEPLASAGVTFSIVVRGDFGNLNSKVVNLHWLVGLRS